MRTETRPQPFYPAAAILLLWLLLWATAGCAPRGDGPEGGPELAGSVPPVSAGAAQLQSAALAGVDVLLSDSLGLVRGRRVGLLTNQTGMSAGTWPGGPGTPTSTVDALHAHPDLDLVALFSPEHGLEGGAQAGEKVASGTHLGTGLPVYSLYTETQRPLPHMLEGVDVLLFDIQDVGARYYTYVWTMALAMQAAGQAGIPFVVLDRPNPIGGEHVQGNVLDPAHATFVGLYPVPMRHGLTPGELARLLVGEYGVEVELRVVPVRGWRRSSWYEDTGLAWIPPSPNMPSVESATHYPGTCLFEGTNLSVGRGTERPFQWVGAPWLDGTVLADALNAYALPGVRFEAASFTPWQPGDGKWPGQAVQGVRFVVTDRTLYDPTRAAVAALLEAKRLAGERWQWRGAHFDALAGGPELRQGVDEGRSLEEITASWDEELAAFSRMREPYLLYP